MKKIKKIAGIIAILAVMCFSLTACGDGGGGHTHDWNTTSEAISEGVSAIKCNSCNGKKYTFDYAVGASGPGGGIIIYVADGQGGRSLGFTVTGTGSFTAYYLEAATSDQGTDMTWCTCTSTMQGGSGFCNVTGATGTAIGAGKANTAAIIAATHDSAITTSNCAAKAANTTISGKNDWFLPSINELNEMYKARSHLGISSGWFWSSSQGGVNFYSALVQGFDSGIQEGVSKRSVESVCAIRAF